MQLKNIPFLTLIAAILLIITKICGACCVFLSFVPEYRFVAAVNLGLAFVTITVSIVCASIQLRREMYLPEVIEETYH
jgi:hypothetical protein